MFGIAWMPERDREVGRADQDGVDTVNLHDRAGQRDGVGVLDLNHDDGLGGGSREVLGERRRPVAAGARRHRQPALSLWRIVGSCNGSRRACGVVDMRDDDTGRTRVERRQDRRRGGGGDPDERRQADRICGPKLVLDLQPAGGAVLGVEDHRVEAGVAGRLDLGRRPRLDEQQPEAVAAAQACGQRPPIRCRRAVAHVPLSASTRAPHRARRRLAVASCAGIRSAREISATTGAIAATPSSLSIR